MERTSFYVRAEGAGGRLIAIGLTTQPTITLGNPVAASSGGLVLSSGLLVPRRFDIGADRAIIGVLASKAPAAPQIEVVLNWFEELRRRVPTR